MIWFVHAPSNASITISPLMSAGNETRGKSPQHTGMRWPDNATWDHVSWGDCWRRLRPCYWNKSVKQRRCLKRNMAPTHHYSASNVLSRNNATMPPEFKAASVLRTLENPDQDGPAEQRQKSTWNVSGTQRNYKIVMHCFIYIISNSNGSSSPLLGTITITIAFYLFSSISRPGDK